MRWSASAAVSARSLAERDVVAVDPGQASGESHARVLQRGEIECSPVRVADELEGRFAAGPDRIGPLADGLVEVAGAVEPPVDVHAPVPAGQAGVPADGQHHVTAGGPQLIGELHAGGGRTHDEHAAVGHVGWAPVLGRRDLVDAPRQVAGDGRDRRAVAPPGGDDDGPRLPGAAGGHDAVALSVGPQRLDRRLLLHGSGEGAGVALEVGGDLPGES